MVAPHIRMLYKGFSDDLYNKYPSVKYQTNVDKLYKVVRFNLQGNGNENVNAHMNGQKGLEKLKK